MGQFAPDDFMTVRRARALRDGVTLFVVSLPSTAANLARRTHAPNMVLIYESGCIGSKPHYAGRSRSATASWRDRRLGGGGARDLQLLATTRRIEVGFLGAAQIDRYRRHINTTVIGGDSTSPRCGCPAPAGRPRSRRCAARWW